MRFLEDHAQETVWVSLFTWMEFAEGYESERADSCRAFLSGFRLLVPDLAIAWQASRISRRLRQHGRTISDHDVWIAASALEHRIPLVTRNTRHFLRVGGLTVLDY